MELVNRLLESGSFAVSLPWLSRSMSQSQGTASVSVSPLTARIVFFKAKTLKEFSSVTVNFGMFTKPVTLVYPVCVSGQTNQAHKISWGSRVTFLSTSTFVSFTSSWPPNSPRSGGSKLTRFPDVPFGAFWTLFTG